MERDLHKKIAREPRRAETREQVGSAKRFPARFRPLAGALLASVLYALALPRVGWNFLIFAVPVVWTLLALREPTSGDEGAKRGFWRRVWRAATGEYPQFWFASFVFWIYVVHWVSFPHPVLCFGWLALAGYLAIYLPLHIGFSRVLNRFARLPIWIAASISWVAIERLRNVVLDGFSFAGLSGAIYNVPELLQLAEPLGEYGVGALIVLVGSLVGAAIALLCAYLYGSLQISKYDDLESAAARGGRPSLKIAILQDSTQYRFPPPKGLNKEVSDKYKVLALEAANLDPDLVVWPEGCYFGYFYDCEADYNPLINSFAKRKIGEKTLDQTEIEKQFPKFAATTGAERFDARDGLMFVRKSMIAQRRDMTRMTARLGAPALLGIASAVFDERGEPTTHNSAVLVPYIGDKTAVDEQTFEELTRPQTSKIVADDSTEFRRYDKIHLVMFGEYVPFLKWLPDSWSIKAICAESVLGRGENPTAFRVSPRDSTAPFVLAPNICFESSVPHKIKSQIRELKEAGADPDVLVNISHDGWFRCGMETDMHLATHVFRAIENRRSVITATHGGFSAWIDPVGRIRATGERGACQVVEANLYAVKVKRSGLIAGRDLGEIWSWGCAALALGAALIWTLRRALARVVRARKTTESPLSLNKDAK